MKSSFRIAKRRVAIAAFLIMGVAAMAQIRVWTRHYDRSRNTDRAKAIALTPDSGLVVTGFSWGPSANMDIATLKLRRSTGDTLWIRRWTYDSTSFDTAVAVAVDDVGNVFVVGKTGRTTLGTDMVTIKYLPDGTQAWAKPYNNGTRDGGVAVAPDRNGGVFVAGWSNLGAGDTLFDYLTIHYASDSTELWVRRYDGTGTGKDWPTALVLDDLGRLYVTGFSWGGTASQFDYLTVRYDTLSGDTVWTRRYDGTSLAPKFDCAYGIAADDSNSIYVTGRSCENGTWYDATTIKYAPDGTQVWVNKFDWGELGNDGATYVKVDHNSNVYCAGCTETSVGLYDFLTYSISRDNGIRWAQVWNGINDDDTIQAMAIDAEGNVFVSGQWYTINVDPDWMTIKYTQDGEMAWNQSYGTFDEDDEPFGMVLDEVGDAYIAGYDYPISHDDYCVLKYTEYDVGVGRVVMPADSFRLGASVTPRAMVRSYSSVTQRYIPVRLEIGGFYFDVAYVDSLLPQDSTLVAFQPWLVEQRALGPHTIQAFTVLGEDIDQANDTAYGTVTGVPVWERLADVPFGPRNKPVKDGGALAYWDTMVYAFKGNNTLEFYGFNLNTLAWAQLETIPKQSRSYRKAVKKGARLAADTTGRVYALKGNNTYDFWRYTIAGDSWRQLDDVPTGARKVKGGACLVYVPGQHSFFAAKGSNTVEYYKFDIARDTWLKRADVPLGERNKKLRDGTCMAYDGVNTIYALKGGTYEFWSYNVQTDSWRRRKDIRISGLQTKKRKMKNGGSMAFVSDDSRFYAMKGGKGTEFWYFDPAADTWVETTDDFPVPPLGRAPYGGADFVYGGGKIFALKGNRTSEFYRYHANFPLNPPLPEGPQAVPAPVPLKLTLAAAPNPFIGRATVRYSLPQAARVRLVLFDVAGRQARVLAGGWQQPGDYFVTLDRGQLAAGVYVAKLQASTAQTTLEASRKVLVGR